VAEVRHRPLSSRGGRPPLFKAMRIVREHAEYLEQQGVAEFVETVAHVFPNLVNVVYLPGVNVANWRGKPCAGLRPAAP
jgi:hypothetical protein